MSAHATTPHDAAHAHSGGNPKMYTKVLIALLCLTCLTVFVARHPFDNATLNVVVALGVATIKALLVGFIFMNLWFDSQVNTVIIFAAFVFLSLLLFACLIDVGNRDVVLPLNYSSGKVRLAPPLTGAVAAPYAEPKAVAPGEKKAEHGKSEHK